MRVNEVAVPIGMSWYEVTILSLTKLTHLANPLQWDAPTINYDFDVTVYSDGTVHVNGSHDGFPAYEIYKSINGGSSSYTIDQYNPYDHGNDITALYPPEDVPLSTTV